MRQLAVMLAWGARMHNWGLGIRLWALGQNPKKNKKVRVIPALSATVKCQ